MTHTSSAPLVSVIVPNWNGEGFIRPCLASLLRQTYAHLEVVVVDDASTDSSPDIVASEFPELTLIRLPVNRGFAHAVNSGIERSQGSIVALLNNDAVADSEWVAEQVSALQRHPSAGSVASKILLWDRPRVLNSVGDLFRRTGVPDNRGVWEIDEGQYDDEVAVFGASGAAAAYRRAMLDEIGLFDERLFMYCEDVDLAFRAQTAGYSCVYAPRARVWHRLSASAGGTLASYHCGRNFVWMLARDVPVVAWRTYGMLLLRTQFQMAWQALRHAREPAARARLRGQAVGIMTAPSLVLQRKRHYRHRRVSEDRLLSLLT